MICSLHCDSISVEYMKLTRSMHHKDCFKSYTLMNNKGKIPVSDTSTVTVCLPLPLSPHPYMVLPVSQSLLVQLVPALCPDYVPGVLS